MKRSLWLYGIVDRAMEDEDSPLRVSFDWLCHVVHADTGVLWLREDGAEDERCISFAGDAVRCQASAEADPLLLAAARKACEENRPMQQEGLLSYVLSSAEAEAFGGIAFLRGDVHDPKHLREALAAFSSTVYSELMSGFLDSKDSEMLRGEDICMNYSRGGLQPNTVDGVSFSIRRGQFTIIMGRSGSGKSTLLNIIGGMLTPTAGSLWWDGKNIAAFSRRQKTAYRRDTLGFIFQNYHLISDLTALENVELAASLSKEADSAADLLRQVGLENRLSSYPTHMSGGEQQRVSIARALVKRPEILLCDEPTGALDTVNSKNIMILLQGLARQRQISVIMVTHNPEFIPLADHFIEMENGRIKTDVFEPFPYVAEDLL